VARHVAPIALVELIRARFVAAPSGEIERAALLDVLRLKTEAAPGDPMALDQLDAELDGKGREPDEDNLDP
jgi:hypothetical protein